MTHPNLAYFDGRYGYLTIVDDFGSAEVTTARAHADRYIYAHDGHQLCAGGGRTGHTLIWASDAAHMAHHFARDCDARLFKSRAGYDRARAKLTDPRP